ncbi:MAG: ribonuclease PH [Olsenella profusa]
MPTSPDASGRRERSRGRAADELRPVTLTPGVMKNADGSCLAAFGDTRVLCSATVEEGVPAWRRGQRAGWVTAEYAMLPASTNRRSPREHAKRKGRSMEIERLVGRSLRAVVDLRRLGELTIICDCDVIQADGGTRAAAITGAWVALHDAVAALLEQGALKRSPLTGQVAAISMGYVGGEALLDLDYPEDSHAEVDMNLVGCEDDRIVEVQGTGERATLGRAQLDVLLDLGQEGIRQLLGLQRQAVGHEGERALGGR